MYEVIHLSYIYQPFSIEKQVTRMYNLMNIDKPEDIDIRKIAFFYRIHLTFSEKRSYSTKIGRFQLININTSLNKMEQREVFFHELCHILRHFGNQSHNMPKAFKDLQEWDAAHFTRYAAIPFHMLKTLDWKSPTLVKDMSKIFHISEDICQERINHIHRNKQKRSSMRKWTNSQLFGI
ncbi:ImmA/IrrE family metallo-endopeptidase [Niallia sp. 03133]|uniref:ImmA/IrrE family metallo-endopeptidase n=1 Tax=Niallia sp. 03133 TaxID=3458060 RepID=UPI004043F01B